jgi:hypothetical protein
MNKLERLPNDILRDFAKTLAIRRDAFTKVMDPGMTPAEHLEAFDKLIAPKIRELKDYGEQ